MAGTVPSLSLSTQFDKNGKLLRSGKVAWYAANTLTPQDAFSDVGLTQKLQNPYTLDGSARVPEFYVADGNIRVRVTDKNGVVQIDARNALVIGPSSGGGGGGSVDATAIYQTGDVMWLDVAGSRTGWVRENGRTIGSATSGASERANADCEDLFVWLWQNKADAVCPVNGGRGASAAADWLANKWITLPDKRGRAPFGLDDMGNASANRLNGITFAAGDATTAGATGGAAKRAILIANLPEHDHGGGKHEHSLPVTGKQQGNASTVYGFDASPISTSGTTKNTTSTAVVDKQGGGQDFETVSPFVLGTFYRKL